MIRIRSRLRAVCIILLATLPVLCAGCGDADTPIPADGDVELEEQLQPDGDDEDTADIPELEEEMADVSEEEAEPEPLMIPHDVNFTPETSFTIVNGGGDHLAFPDVAKVADGSLVLVYRRGSSHVDATGKIMKIFGDARGTIWYNEEVLYDVPDMDDRDPSITTLPGGELAVNYFQYLTRTVGNTTLSTHHIFYGTSGDAGATFSAFGQVDPGDMLPVEPVRDGDGVWVDGQGEPIIIEASSAPVIAHKGLLLLPAYGGNALNLANLGATAKSRITLYTSSDNGQSWQGAPVNRFNRPDAWLMEPAILALDNGRLLMHIRTALGASPSNAGPLMQAVSDDDGATWSDWEEFGFTGHAPELYQLGNGVVISAFRWINDAFTAENVSFMYSTDRGETWSGLIEIADCGAAECGYPGVMELDNGGVLMVYYAPGGGSIKGVIYHVEEVQE